MRFDTKRLLGIATIATTLVLFVRRRRSADTVDTAADDDGTTA